MRAKVTIERWPLKVPFAIAREVQTDVPMIHVRLTSQDGIVGQAEAVGIDYDGETPQSMSDQIGTLNIDGLTRASLPGLLGPGGARNALDCALWDIEAKRSGALFADDPSPILTTFTIGLGDTAEKVRAVGDCPLIKVKVDENRHLGPVRVVRDMLPDARILVDANESWTAALLEQLLPDLQALGVEVIEQPLPRGGDAALAQIRSPIPVAADESCTDLASLAGLVELYDAVNLKLDKCGGLTEALAMVQQAKHHGLRIMVGNMCGTSLGMAPAFIVARQAEWADLDGPLLLTRDREPAMRFDKGYVFPPLRELWG